MPQRVIVLPEKSAKNTSLESFTFNGLTYLFDKQNSLIYEMVKYSEVSRSWFINDSVEEDGSLIMFTPVDVLYLIIPFLMKNDKQYRSLYDILSEEPTSQIVHRCFLENSIDLSVVADVKKIDEEEYVKFNCDKSLKWLKCKVKTVEKALFANNVTTSSKCAQISGFVSGREEKDKSKDDTLKYATELVGNYIPQELLSKLKKYLNVDFVEEKATKIENEKRKCEYKTNVDCGTDESEVNERRAENQTKRMKTSKTHKELEKAKKGTKSVAFYFALKPKQ